MHYTTGVTQAIPVVWSRQPSFYIVLLGGDLEQQSSTILTNGKNMADGWMHRYSRRLCLWHYRIQADRHRVTEAQNKLTSSIFISTKKGITNWIKSLPWRHLPWQLLASWMQNHHLIVVTAQYLTEAFFFSTSKSRGTMMTQLNYETTCNKLTRIQIKIRHFNIVTSFFSYSLYTAKRTWKSISVVQHNCCYYITLFI